MLELLHHVFGWICGQNPAHTWTPGGESLPLCQRCTGVYVGAFVAALLHLAQRPVPTSRWLWLNGAFLLFMIPSGFYWIPQNPELRCASGILFGFGLVAFFWLALPGKFTIYDLRFTSQTKNPEPKPSDGFYKTFAASLTLALVATPLLAEYGNAAAAEILALLSAAGVLVLALLYFANCLLTLRWVARKFSRHSA